MVDHRILAGLVLAVSAGSACTRARPRPPEGPPPKVTMTVLPAESDAFPKAAQAATASLATARVDGVDETQVSQVSLEVVQLSIECVEPTEACYAAVGATLSTNRLLFAKIGPAGTRGRKRKEVKVTVTLFDVDGRTPRTAEKVFASEREATAGIGDLVGEATRP